MEHSLVDDSNEVMEEDTVFKMAVMGLLKSIQSSRWQFWGYGRGYNLEDGSNGIMKEDIV